MRLIHCLLILILAAQTIESVRMRRNRKLRRQNTEANISTETPTISLETTPQIENVTEIFITERPKKSSIQQEIKLLMSALKASRNSSEKVITDIKLEDERKSAEKTSEKARIINIQVEKHIYPRKIDLECKFGNVSDYLSVENPGRFMYTCESFNLRVMADNTHITHVYGEHAKTFDNHNVIVLRNIFSKSRFLPNGIANIFPNLLHLYIPSSRLKFISRRNFVGMSELHTLDVRYNEIETLPADVFLDLFNLEILSISGNYLKRLPPNAFINLHSLRYIDSSDNEISIFDDEIFSTNLELEEILFDHNRIKSVKANFERFRDVGFIDLRGNVCIDTLYLRDHPDYPLLFEFQEEINYNCTQRNSRDIKLLAGTADVQLSWELCSKLKLPTNMINGKMCLTEKRNN